MAIPLSSFVSRLRSRLVPVVLAFAMLGIVVAAAISPNVGVVEAQPSCPYGNCGGGPPTPFFQTPAGEATIAGIIVAIIVAAILAVLLMRRRSGGGRRPSASEEPPAEEPPAPEAEVAPPPEAPAEEAPPEEAAPYDELSGPPAEPEGSQSIEDALDELERESDKYGNGK